MSENLEATLIAPTPETLTGEPPTGVAGHPSAEERRREKRREYDRKRRRDKNRRYYANVRAFPMGVRAAVHPCEPSPAQLAERDRAYAEWGDITAEMMGDPPRGRSALDRRARQ